MSWYIWAMQVSVNAVPNMTPLSEIERIFIVKLFFLQLFASNYLTDSDHLNSNLYVWGSWMNERSPRFLPLGSWDCPRQWAGQIRCQADRWDEWCYSAPAPGKHLGTRGEVSPQKSLDWRWRVVGLHWSPLVTPPDWSPCCKLYLCRGGGAKTYFQLLLYLLQSLEHFNWFVPMHRNYSTIVFAVYLVLIYFILVMMLSSSAALIQTSGSLYCLFLHVYESITSYIIQTPGLNKLN